MRLSRYFMPTLREAPSDAQIVSHQLMLRAGLIKQEAAGIYAWLPLGHRVLRKVEQIVREEMDRAGAVELLNDGAEPAAQVPQLGRPAAQHGEKGAGAGGGAEEMREHRKSPAVQAADEMQQDLQPRLDRLHQVADRLYDRWSSSL